MESVTSKTCRRCERNLPGSEFYSSRVNSDGLWSWCKPCSREYAKAQREAQGPEASRQYQADYRAANAEKIRSKNARQYQKNRSRRLAERAAYYASNRERIRELERAKNAIRKAERDARAAQFRADHPDIVAAEEEARRARARTLGRIRSSRRRSREKSAPVYLLSDKDIRRLSTSGCAVPGCTGLDIHIDHIIPVARGGSHGIGNLQALCAHHNASKGAKTWMEFRAYLRSQ